MEASNDNWLSRFLFFLFGVQRANFRSLVMKRTSLALILIIFFTGVFTLEAKKKPDQKETKYRNALLMAYSPVNSVYEDGNIKLMIYGGKLYAKNLTDKTIFINLSQCFLINNGSSYPMYSESTDEKKASKAKKSTSIEEFLSIAPATGSNQNVTYLTTLNTRTLGKYSSSEGPSEEFSNYDRRLLNLVDEMLNESLQADPNGKEYLGTVKRHLTEEESISNIGASIAYAFNKNAEDWNNVTISTWVADVIFAPYYREYAKNLSKEEKKGFGVKVAEKGKAHVKASTPFEFEEDRSPLLIMDFEGNFNKGFFTLRNLSDVQTEVLYHDFSDFIIVFDGEEADWGTMKKVKGYFSKNSSGDRRGGMTR